MTKYSFGRREMGRREGLVEEEGEKEEEETVAELPLRPPRRETEVAEA